MRVAVPTPPTVFSLTFVPAPPTSLCNVPGLCNQKERMALYSELARACELLITFIFIIIQQKRCNYSRFGINKKIRLSVSQSKVYDNI